MPIVLAYTAVKKLLVYHFLNILYHMVLNDKIFSK